MKNDNKSMWMMISSMLIFGSIGILRRYIPFSSAFLSLFRGISGGIFILIFIILKGNSFKEKIPFKTVLWFVVSGAVMGVNWMLLFEAYNYTSVATATLCYYMEPTIVMLLSPILFKEKLTSKKLLCSIIAITGMILVSGIINSPTSNNLYGVLLGLGAAVFYSIVVIMNKKTNGINAYIKTMIQLLSAGLAMAPYLLLTNGFKLEGVNTSTIILLMIVGIVHTGIAYVLYFGSMDGLKAQTIAILGYIDPVAALIFSSILLKETLSLTGAIGAIMIIGAALISEIEFKK